MFIAQRFAGLQRLHICLDSVIGRQGGGAYAQNCRFGVQDFPLVSK